jgi:hypothetical protein
MIANAGTDQRARQKSSHGWIIASLISPTFVLDPVL